MELPSHVADMEGTSVVLWMLVTQSYLLHISLHENMLGCQLKHKV